MVSSIDYMCSTLTCIVLVWHGIKESEVPQLCLTLCDPMDCSLPGSSVRGILQARVLEWVAISFSRGSSQFRDRTWVSHIANRCFTIWATREALTSLKAGDNWKVNPLQAHFFSLLHVLVAHSRPPAVLTIITITVSLWHFSVSFYSFLLQDTSLHCDSS